MYQPYKGKMDVANVMKTLKEIQDDLKSKSTSTELQELVGTLD